MNIATADNPGIAAETAAAQPLISFQGVGKTFQTSTKTVCAVENVDLAVPRGEFITLVGPSGCGKSTLLNMTAGLFPPTAGQVFYGGRAVTTYYLSTGYMPQHDKLLPSRARVRKTI